MTLSCWSAVQKDSYRYLVCVFRTICSLYKDKSSAIADMATQCEVSVLTHFHPVASENITELYCWKVDSFGL